MGFLDSGMVVVLFITVVLLLVTGLLLFHDFEVKCQTTYFNLWFSWEIISYQAHIMKKKNSKQTISICIFIYFFTLWNLFAAVAQKGLKPTVDEGKTVLPSKKQKTGNKCRTFCLLPNSFCLHCFQLLKVVKKYPRQGSTIEIPLWFGQIILNNFYVQGYCYSNATEVGEDNIL